MSMKTYMIVAPVDRDYFEVYVKADGWTSYGSASAHCGRFVCQCKRFEWAKEICAALEKLEQGTP